MPRTDSEAVDDGADDGLSRWQRFTGSLSNMMLKPAVAAETATGEDRPKASEPTTIPEIEEAIKRCSDKERVIGLLAAPIAAAIVFAVTATLVHNDPAATVNGLVNPHHTNPSDYTELGLVTLALALVMLGGAWFRKRLVIGIASALYGLSYFNLHYWGFGVPYIMIGAWYMVRAYRLSQKLKLAKAGITPSSGPSRAPSQPNKRYTPPTTSAVRAPKPKPKPGKELGAG
jgi:hypothetical protein